MSRGDRNMQEIANRNALITGATGGIGRCIASELAARGVNLALVARKAGKLEELADRLASADVTVTAIAADLTDPDDMRNLPRRVRSEFGQIDILINNAGIEDLVAFYRQDPERIDAVLETNLLAPMRLVREVLPDMLDRKYGHIVNISSVAGHIGLPYEAVYSASKAGINAWSTALRQELRDTGIGISVVAPGFVGGAGMFARGGSLSPPSVGLNRPADVARAVVRAIVDDVSEIIVNRTPIRPLLTLLAASPKLGAAALRMTRLEAFMRKLAGG